MKQGITLLSVRGWMDGHVVEVKATRREKSPRWTWTMSSITTAEALAYGRFIGNARRMSAELFNILEGTHGDDA